MGRMLSRRKRGAAGPIDHATGTGFRRDKSTTAAVAWRMRIMPYLLRGEQIPPIEKLMKDERRDKAILTNKGNA